MDLIIENNGNLTFAIGSAADYEALTELRERNNDDRMFLLDALDYFGHSCNDRMHVVRPETFGALTDAPIVTNHLDHQDNGKEICTGEVWWYPQYETIHLGDVLLKTGRVTLQHAVLN